MVLRICYSKGEERFVYFSKSIKGKSNGTSNIVKLCQAHTLQAKQFAEASIFLPTIQEVMGWTKNIRQIEMVTIKFAHFHNFHSKFTCVRNYLPNNAHFFLNSFSSIYVVQWPKKGIVLESIINL